MAERSSIFLTAAGLGLLSGAIGLTRWTYTPWVWWLGFLLACTALMLSAFAMLAACGGRR